MSKHYSLLVLMIVIPSKAQKSGMCFEGDDDGEVIHNLWLKLGKNVSLL